MVQTKNTSNINSFKEMPIDTNLKFEMVAIKKQSKFPSLADQVLCFIDFLNSTEFIANPKLENLYVQLVSLYHSAVFYSLSYKISKRYYFSESYVLEYERGMPEGKRRLEEYLNYQVVGGDSLEALQKISFVYYTSFPEHEQDNDVPIHRSLISDMQCILSDLCRTIKFNNFFDEYADKMPSVSDQLFRDFNLHWGSNHCVDLIRAIQWKLKDNFKWHNSICRDTLKK